MDVRINARAAFRLLWPFLSQNLVLPCTSRPSSVRSHRAAASAWLARCPLSLARTLVLSCSALHIYAEETQGQKPGLGSKCSPGGRRCQWERPPGSGVASRPFGISARARTDPVPVWDPFPAEPGTILEPANLANRHQLSPSLPRDFTAAIFLLYLHSKSTDVRS